MTSLSPLSVRALLKSFEQSDSRRHAKLLLRQVRAGAVDVMNAQAEHPLADDWRDFSYSAIREHFERAAGLVYVVTNPMNLGFYKVGKTAFAMERRLSSSALNNEAVVGEFHLVQAFPTADRHFSEVRAQGALAELPRHKEFFKGDWRPICNVVQQSLDEEQHQLARNGLLELAETAMARYRQPAGRSPL